MSASIQRIEGGYALSGKLGFSTVAGLFDQTIAATADKETVFDLSKIESVDSAGVALLVEWAGRLKSAGSDLKLLHAPDQLNRLIQVGELEQILPPVVEQP